MAQEPWFLKEDGYLNVNTKASFIIHHPNLNVILVCTKTGEVTVIDVNSGDVLQSISLSGEGSGNIGGRYLPGLDKILFWNDLGIGLRSDYNGVLLLHTILQMPVSDQKQTVKLELLLSEAILLRQSLKGLLWPNHGQWAEFTKMLDQRIEIAKSNAKKGIKVQKWNTVELSLSYSWLAMIIATLHSEMRSSEQCVPGMAIVASLHERLGALRINDPGSNPEEAGGALQGDPLLDPPGAPQQAGSDDPERIKMYSEAARRKTFDRWPHMDYKWALPDQMAQAGFYHKPTAVGDDRAMCFTCSVCLVCWDRTDEPWSEHERHSPGCPFVKGEYTQNVPIGVTYATGTAGVCPGEKAISSGEHSEFVCTSEPGGEITVWSVGKELERKFRFRVTPKDLGLKEEAADITMSVTALAVMPSQNDNQNKTNLVTNASSNKNEPLRIICAVDVQIDSRCVTFLVEYDYSVTPAMSKLRQDDDGTSPSSGSGGARKATTNTAVNKDDVMVMYIDEHGQIPQQLGLKKKKKKQLYNKDKPGVATFHFSSDQDNHQQQSPGTELFGIPENPDDESVSCSYEYFVDSSMYDKPIIHSPGSVHFPNNSGNILAKLLFKNDLPAEGLEALITKFIKYKGEKGDTSSTFTDVMLQQMQQSKQVMQNAGILSNDMNCDNSDSCLSCQSDATDFSGLNGYAPAGSEGTSATIVDKAAHEQNAIGTLTMDTDSALVAKRTAMECRTVKLANCIDVAFAFQDDGDKVKRSISHILPARDGRSVVVFFKTVCEARGDQMEIDGDEPSLLVQAAVIMVDAQQHCLMPISVVERKLLSNETPLELRTISARRRPSGLILMTSVDGIVRLVDMLTLGTIASTSPSDGFYVSACYCSGLGRLCACTDQGLLRFYSVNGEDNDYEDEEEEDIGEETGEVDNSCESTLATNAAAGGSGSSQKAEKPLENIVMIGQNIRMSLLEDHTTDSVTDEVVVGASPCKLQCMVMPFNRFEPLANKKQLVVSDLRQLYSLSLFDEACFPYGATVPACWCRLVQAQKQRRQPQRVRAEDAQHAYAWRLQNDATTWDEHIFELTLPYSCNLGHIDFKFSLHSPCNVAPNIQVTLLKQLGGIGHHGKTDSSDRTDSRTSGGNSTTTVDDDSNPVLTSEYLRAQHAELLAGPIQLVSGLDLSGQGGVVTLTGPALIKNKARSLLLHVKTMFHPVQQEQETKIRENVGIFGNISGASHQQASTNTETINTASSNKGQNYIGCDWLHEVAISVRSCKQVNIAHARLHRTTMLESDILLQNLLQIATLCSPDTPDKPRNTRLVRCLALDVVAWLLNVRMTRSRLPEAGKRQVECARIVQGALDGLVAISLLAAGRSEARKCVKLLLVCSNGVSDLPPSAPMVPFDQSLLRSLLRYLQNGALPKIRSASALRWYCLLLIRYAPAESKGALAVAERCLRLLRRAATERNKRRDPYTDLLKARFGLNGIPFESEIFDVELPQQVQQRGLFSVLGNRKPKAVSDLADMTAKPIPGTKGLRGLGEVQPLHFLCHSASEGTRLEKMHQTTGNLTSVNYDVTPNIVYKQFDCPKDLQEDVLEPSSTLSINCKLGKLLMSVEKELAKAKSSLGHKDLDMEVADYQPTDAGEDMSVDADDAKGSTFTSYLVPSLAQTVHSENNPPNWSPSSAATTASHTNNSEYSQVYVRPYDIQIGDEYILPWARLLTPPSQQAILIERMHSCARRFVILDFGRPILLTDLAVPSCNELMSLALDYWVTSEDGESTRLALASDIGTRSLIMKDLQPPPVLRYLKMTMIGRYGMTATRVRLSAGRYYGHTAILEADFYSDNTSSTNSTSSGVGSCSTSVGTGIASVIMSTERARAQLPSLDSLQEDTASRYRLACCGLREILKPLLALAPVLAEKCAEGEDEKVLQAYQECISLQQQLNVLRSVTSRLREACEDGMSSPFCSMDQNASMPSHESAKGDGSPRYSVETELSTACTDKLRVLCESLVVVLLQLLQKTGPKMSATIARLLDADTCSELFSSLVVHGDSASQISCCALLCAACSTRPWWGIFLADSLQSLYSTSSTQLFAKERVFLLLTHLGRRGNPRSRVLDAALLALIHLLAPLAPRIQVIPNSSSTNSAAPDNDTNDEDDIGPLSARIDLSLLSWLLLYLSACLDDGKEQNNSRWDFMSGQTSTQRPRTESERNQDRAGATRVYRRKLQKRLMHHKIQLDDLESAKKAFQVSSQVAALSNLSSQATNLSAKLDAALKQQDNVFKKTLKIHTQKVIPFKTVLEPDYLSAASVSGGASTSNSKDSAHSSTQNSENPPPPPPPDNTPPADTTPPDPMHCLAVCRALLALLLRFDATCGADIFLMTCKVLAKLAGSCKPVVTLSQLASSEQLQLLIRRCVWTDGRRPQWAGAWAQHAATCLLQDLVEAETKREQANENAPGRSDTVCVAQEVNAHLWDSMRTRHSSAETNLDISIEEPEEETQGSLLSKSHVQLPSLMESDDSELEEFLDDVLDRGRNLLKRSDQSARINAAPNSSVSSALDARLESGLDTTAELLLRRLKLSATTIPVSCSSPTSPLGTCESPSITSPSSLSPEDQMHLVAWLGGHPYVEPRVSAAALLSPCFDALFTDLHLQTGGNLEALLRLWTALNDQATCRIVLSPDSLRKLISALAWLDAIPLRAWSLGFQCLSVGVLLTETPGGRLTPKGAAAALLDEPDFRAMLVRFLSGDGDSTCAGPTACQAMYKCLLRLKGRCEDETHFRNAMLRVLLHLLRPGQPVAAQQGPQDAQARFVHGLLHAGYERCDLATAMTVIESIGALVAAHTARCERVRCRSLAECSTAPLTAPATAPVTNPATGGITTITATSAMTGTTTMSFGGLFASVLGNSGGANSPQGPPGSAGSKVSAAAASSHGAGRHASAEALLVALLRLANRLVCTPLVPMPASAAGSNSSDRNEPMDTGEEQTDERKAERLSTTQSDPGTTPPQRSVPLLADTVLRHGPTTSRFLRSLCSRGTGIVKAFLASSFSTNLSSTDPQNSDPEPRGVADALYVLLDTMVRVASDQTLVAKPLYDFLLDCVHGGGNTPRLRITEPLVTLLLRALAPAVTVIRFAELGGIRVTSEGLVRCHSNLVSARPGRVSAVMRCLGRRDAESCKGENLLENLAPLARISPMNGVAQSAEALLQAAPAHRRARTPAWAYHFYPEEAHAELLLTLPAAALLREVHVQPHLTTLSTCPSAIAIEISPDTNTPLTPVCAPMACAGMTLIRLQLPRPEVASRILIRLYRPRDNPNLGLTQIRLLGCSVFNETGNYVYGVDGADDEHRCSCSAAWLALLQQCLQTKDPEQLSSFVAQAAAVPGLLRACCALLIAPSTCHGLAHDLLLLLTKDEHTLGLRVIDILLRDGSEVDHACIDPTAPGGVADHVAELLGALCATRNLGDDIDELAADEYIKSTTARTSAALDWLVKAGEAALRRESGRQPCACCVHELAAVLWSEQQSGGQQQTSYTALPTRHLTITVYRWTRLLPAHSSLKQALDAILCAACRMRPELLHALLRDSGAAVRDARAACMSDDSKDGSGLTDDSKHRLESDYTSEDTIEDAPLAAQDPSLLQLDEGQLETLAMACQSPAGVSKLFDSGLLEILTNSILVFVKQHKNDERMSSQMTDTDKAGSSANNIPMATASGVAATLNFLAELCAEADICQWLGSTAGSSFWHPLLNLLCCNCDDLNTEQSSKLEAAAINFLSRACACNPQNQRTLATVLCKVISAQSIPSREAPYSGGVSGFTRRLVLQLLLRSERVLVSVYCESRVVPRPGPATAPALCVHPALRSKSGSQLLIMPAHAYLHELAGYYTCNIVNSGLPPMAPPGPTRDSRRELWEYSLKSIDPAGIRDKRLKEAKNYASRNSKRSCTNDLENEIEQKPQEIPIIIWHPMLPKPLPRAATISQLLHGLKSRDLVPAVCQSTMLDIGLSTTQPPQAVPEEETWLTETDSLLSPIEVFSSLAGLSLLAQRLPVVPIIPHRNYASDMSGSSQADRAAADAQEWMDLAEWVKIPTSLLLQVEAAEEIYCDDNNLDDLSSVCPSPPVILPQSRKGGVANSQLGVASPVPAHALAAFALFLRLPGYAEVLLRDRLPAQCLLRLMLGVSDDGEGNDIFSLPLAAVLPTLPFCVLRRLLDATPLTTDDGLLLRLNFVDVGALHLVLGCLSVFTHHSPQQQENENNSETSRTTANATTTNNTSATNQHHQGNEKGLYWAKGTGFGTGSTQQSWNVEQALARQRGEEQHVTSLLQALSAFINPGDMRCEVTTVLPDAAELLPTLRDALKKSCLLPAISSYLRNDSVLDMARHVPLYRAVLQLLRAIAQSNKLAVLLLPSTSTEDATPIANLLATMKQCVDTYAMRLKSNSRITSKVAPIRSHSSTAGPSHPTQQLLQDEDDEGLAQLIPDIQETAVLVQNAVDRLQAENKVNEDSKPRSGNSPERPMTLSLEQRYLQTMRRLQFDTFEMMIECTGTTTGGFRFTIPYHYENSVRAMGNRCCHPGRVKRLAQEAVTLSTSLPLSYSSSVFVRCDTDRLDVMKVLITGPADTPYANGCFELDVFFPPDYPASPMHVHLETTGRQSVRFNPNLYNDGKVCLSVLNTWHGRPEEKWNAQTSSFLQVLVSIQSLILVPEPYFNEPGYERCRGTPSGANSSREYNGNIYQACVRWAMLEQLRQPCACFREVVQTHFWMKRHEIVAQVESWITELESHGTERRTGRAVSLNAVTLKRYYKLLREELAKLPVPEGMSEMDQPPFSAESSPTTPTAPVPPQTAIAPAAADPWAPETGVTYHQPLPSTQPDVVLDTPATETTDTDVEMEKIVSDVLCE